MKIYLAGGIAGLNPDEVLNRFEYIRKTLEMLDGNDDKPIEVLSPIRGKKLDAECDQRYEPNEIVDRDLWDISHADLMIACPSEKSIGTFMEIFFAATQCRIPVIVVAQGHIAKHYWIRHFASKIVPTIEDAIEYLCDWYIDGN